MFGPADEPAKPDLTRRLLITNRRGLHARAAAKFVKTAERFAAAISVVRLDGAELKSTGEEVSGRSIMGLMMLAAAPGTTIELRATGSDAAAALDALTQLVEAKFDED
jgi:phosphocarrier protein HPr